MPKPRILVIDDEAPIRDSLKMTLEYEGYDVIGAATGQEGLALAEREAPDLVLLDVKMPGMDGIEVLERLRNMNDSLPVVVVSGHGTISTAVEATKKGAFDFIEKPFASERVLVSLRNALDSAVERGAHRLDARDQHAARLPRQLEAFRRLAIDVADGQAERKVVGVELRALRRGPRRRVGLVRALARRPLGELHGQRLIAPVAHEMQPGRRPGRAR